MYVFENLFPQNNATLLCLSRINFISYKYFGLNLCLVLVRNLIPQRRPAGADLCWDHTGIEIRRDKESEPCGRDGRVGVGGILRCCVCMVLGSVGMVGAKRDFSHGDSLRRTSHRGVLQLALHLHHCSSIPHHSVSLQVRIILVLRSLGDCHDLVCLLLRPRD